MMKRSVAGMPAGRFAYYIPADGFIEGQGFRVSVVFENERGHFPTGDWPYEGKPSQRMPWFWGMTYEEATAVAQAQNARLGLTPEEAFLIVTSSMRGMPRRET